MGKISKPLLKWRGTLKEGSIMKAATFKTIAKKAALAWLKKQKELGKKITPLLKTKAKKMGEKIAGSAYWKTAKSKYARRNPEKYSIVEYAKIIKKPVPKFTAQDMYNYITWLENRHKKKKKKNPIVDKTNKWYVGVSHTGHYAREFYSPIRPTRKLLDIIFKEVHGPFKTKTDATTFIKNGKYKPHPLGTMNIEEFISGKLK